MEQALTKVLVERERLLARSAQQREAIAIACANLAGPASLIDRAIGFGRFLRAHPAAVAVLVGGVLALRSRSVLALAASGIGVWRFVRRLRALAGLFFSR